MPHGSTSDWEPLLGGNGSPVAERRVVNFITDVPPNYIPIDNIAYSYPIDRQMNLHKTESGTGYIQLKQGQDYLFTTEDYTQKVRYIQNTTALAQFDVGYNSSSNKLSFPIASSELANSAISQAAILSVPLNSEAAVDANVVGTTTELFSNQDSGTEDPPANGEPNFTEILMIGSFPLFSAQYCT